MQPASVMKPDSDLQKTVMQALALDPHVDESAIGVSVRHGIVTLDGIVPTYAERDAAASVAHHVLSVQDVANEISVRPGWHTTPSDSEVAEAVRNALAETSTVPHERIQTTVSGRGHVILSGMVSTLQQRDDAEAAVRALYGVEIVTNLLEIAAPATSTSVLRDAVEHALERHIERDAGRVGIEVRGETIVVTGSVESSAQRRAVVGAIKGTAGVKRVDDRLRVAS